MSDFKPVMERYTLATDSTRVKNPVVPLRRWMMFLCGKLKGMRSLRPEPSENGSDERDDITKSPTSDEETDSKPPKFEAFRRRAAICDVLEEKQPLFGMALSELRKDLVIRKMLEKEELL